MELGFVPLTEGWLLGSGVGLLRGWEGFGCVSQEEGVCRCFSPAPVVAGGFQALGTGWGPGRPWLSLSPEGLVCVAFLWNRLLTQLRLREGAAAGELTQISNHLLGLSLPGPACRGRESPGTFTLRVLPQTSGGTAHGGPLPRAGPWLRAPCHFPSEKSGPHRVTVSGEYRRRQEPVQGRPSEEGPGL